MTAMVFLSVREAANQRAESSTVYFCISFAQITIDSSSCSRVSEKRTFFLFPSLSLSLSLGPYFFLKILFPLAVIYLLEILLPFFVPGSFGERMKRKA